MAFRFGLTELFEHAVERAALTEILAQHQKPDPPLLTPYELTPECFRRIYRLGMGLADSTL